MIIVVRHATDSVRQYPQRFMGKAVGVPQSLHGRVRISWERWIKSRDQNTASFFEKKITEESDLENFQDLMVTLDVCCWLHKAISIGLSPFGDDGAIEGAI